MWFKLLASGRGQTAEYISEISTVRSVSQDYPRIHLYTKYPNLDVNPNHLTSFLVTMIFE
jgi:hypothetical protein